MNEPTTPTHVLPVKTKTPANAKVIHQWVAAAAQQTDIASKRLTRWVGFMIVAAMLDHARHENDGRPLFLIKGGVAMELHLNLEARATKDLDTAFRAAINQLADYLDPALQAGFGHFAATRTELEHVRETGMQRCDVKLTYKGKSLCTVQLEVAAAEATMGDDIEDVPAKPLDMIGIDGPDTVPCLAVHWIVAQKLHACTEVIEERENDRFRDLLDLPLLASLIADDRWERTRTACIELFEGRNKHAWPPQITIFDRWPEGFTALAEETGSPTTDIDEAAAQVDELIARIDAAVPPAIRP